MPITRRNLLLSTAAAAAVKAEPSARLAAAAPAPIGRKFTGESLREIGFPLGGLGTSTVSLGGFGNLRDWEIFNRPNKGGVLPFTFAALHLSGGGLAKPRTRVIERRPLPPFNGYSGVPRETALGLPRFREAIFTGAYPFANIRFQEPSLPVAVSLEAFNPMIPLATDDSSLPVAVLTYRVTSRAKSKLDAALAFSIMNPVGYDGIGKLSRRRADFFGSNLNQFKSGADAAGVLMTSTKYPAGHIRYGSMALVTVPGDLSWRMQWSHGGWWDDFHNWWDEFHGQGRFPNVASKPSDDKTTDYASLAAHFSLAPGESKDVTFVIAWHFPNTANYWTREKEYHDKPLRNEYGTRWTSAWAPAAYTLKNLASLRARSAAYRDTLHGSTLPPAVIDAVSSQASIARTNTVMVLAGQRTMAFEGCDDNAGCCPMNCTHVYNYEQSMAHLYPDIERSMRETDFLINMRPDGSMGFRTSAPPRPGGMVAWPAADGQMGCIL
jgi:non-lysosomal glucosylceramidase